MNTEQEVYKCLPLKVLTESLVEKLIEKYNKSGDSKIFPVLLV